MSVHSREFAANLFWRPRFSLRALLLFVTVAAVAFAGFDGWRRVQRASDARAHCERLMSAWNWGLIPFPEVIAASQNLVDAERRQWFSGAYEYAILDSHLLRLKEIEGDLRWRAQHGHGHQSEEDRAAAWKQVEYVASLVREVEILKAQTFADPPPD